MFPISYFVLALKDALPKKVRPFCRHEVDGLTSPRIFKVINLHVRVALKLMKREKNLFFAFVLFSYSEINIIDV